MSAKLRKCEHCRKLTARRVSEDGLTYWYCDDGCGVQQRGIKGEGAPLHALRDMATGRNCGNCEGTLYVGYQFKRHGRTICGGCETIYKCDARFRVAFKALATATALLVLIPNALMVLL